MHINFARLTRFSLASLLGAFVVFSVLFAVVGWVRRDGYVDGVRSMKAAQVQVIVQGVDVPFYADRERVPFILERVREARLQRMGEPIPLERREELMYAVHIYGKNELEQLARFAAFRVSPEARVIDWQVGFAVDASEEHLLLVRYVLDQKSYMVPLPLKRLHDDHQEHAHMSADEDLTGNGA